MWLKISSALFLVLLFSSISTGCQTPEDVRSDDPAQISLYGSIFQNDNNCTGFRFDDNTDRVVTDDDIKRITLDNRTVQGIYAPPNGVLWTAFFSGIDNIQRVSVLLGIEGEISDTLTGCTVRLTLDDPHFEEPVTFYEINLQEFRGSENSWTNINVPISVSTVHGNITFEIDNRENIPEDLKFFWGAPAVYTPTERYYRNVLLIGVDTLRADAVSLYGGRNFVTPTLEELGRGASMFTQARAQSSWTLPSFASIITGGLPSRIGTTIESGRIPETATTIGEILRPYGYATSTICGNTYLGNINSGFQQGFDELWYEFAASPDKSVDQAMDYIDRVNDRDWLCFLHFLDPHGPYTPTDEFASKTVDPNYSGTFGNNFHAAEAWKSGEFIPPDEDINHARNLFDAEVAMIDSALGRLFDYLVENDLYDDTLIIISSDHGEEFFEHGAFEHGHSMYDEVVRMPLIVKGPGFPGGGSFDTCVGNTDIVPTILEFLKISPSGILEGDPLQRVVSGEIGNDRIIYGEGNNRGTHRKFAVEWPYKCILDYVTGETLLFNIESDPGEFSDLSDAEPEIVLKMSHAMSQKMLPDRSVFHVWFIGSPQEPAKRFSGSITFSSGIGEITAHGIEPDDVWSYDSHTLTFDIANTVPDLAIDKNFTIFPSTDSVEITASVLIDPQTGGEYFYPYGNLEPELSGTATIDISEYPLGIEMPGGQLKLPPGMYIFGMMGFEHGEDFELDEESKEQLRALGYADG